MFRQLHEPDSCSTPGSYGRTWRISARGSCVWKLQTVNSWQLHLLSNCSILAAKLKPGSSWTTNSCIRLAAAELLPVVSVSVTSSAPGIFRSVLENVFWHDTLSTYMSVSMYSVQPPPPPRRNPITSPPTHFTSHRPSPTATAPPPTATATSSMAYIRLQCHYYHCLASYIQSTDTPWYPVCNYQACSKYPPSILLLILFPFTDVL